MSVDRAQISDLCREQREQLQATCDAIIAERDRLASELQAVRGELVTVPREEWEVLNTISAFWCPPFGVPQNTATEALFAKLDALRSGEAENKGGA